MKTEIHAIIQKIHDDAQLHGDQRYMQIKDDIDKEIKEENAAYLEEFEKRCDLLRKHNEHKYECMTERLEGRMRRELLAYQYELIGEIAAAAIEKLKNISGEEMLQLIVKATKGIRGYFDLHPGEYSAGKIQSGDLQKVNDGSLLIILSDKVIPGKSGFVISNNTLEYNCLFEDLIEDKKNRQLPAILKEVFE